MTNKDFQEMVLEKARELYRDMPWRTDTRPYYVLVSEIMLQQTQVSRVLPKFEAFIKKFPDEKSLAAASLADVLMKWQGLGYNRRAKYLHQAAKKIVELDGFPATEKDLMALPGVGKNTAGAICAYSFNLSSVFVETNIRTVYIHHFFNDEFDINDKQILEKLKDTIDTEHPREFYWSLMDYGSWLKANGVRNNASSKHYVKQAQLKGSVREVRGYILRQLVAGEPINYEIVATAFDETRAHEALEGLARDAIIHKKSSSYHLTKA